MTHREEKPPDPATSSQSHPAQLHLLHLKSVAQTLTHRYAAHASPETPSGPRPRKFAAFKLLNALGPFRSRWRH